jgi:quercetin dioxygenase-like cupin family protein
MAEGLSIKNLNHLRDIIPAEGVPVHGAPALGLPLHTNGNLGADLLFVPRGERFPVHTHPGDHLLLCVAGAGTISIGEETYEVQPGDIYMVDGQVPHAVGAHPSDHHVLVAIGSPHKPVESPERMQFTDWTGRKVDAPIFAD